MKKKAGQKHQISNRRARYDYALDDTLVVGIALNGRETKSLRMGQGSLQGAYVIVQDSTKGGELWLINALIPGVAGAKVDEGEQTRSRKLLAKRREIEHLIAAKAQGKTIVPLEILAGGRFIKVRIAAGRGKRKYDKRETIKKREEERRIKAI